jgi:hypothetical protein
MMTAWRPGVLGFEVINDPATRTPWGLLSAAGSHATVGSVCRDLPLRLRAVCDLSSMHGRSFPREFQCHEVSIGRSAANIAGDLGNSRRGRRQAA